jgi:hypothetical protein
MYHATALEYQLNHPVNFKIFHVDDLNSINGRNQILDFVNYTGERNIEGNFRGNSRRDNRNLKYRIKQLLGLTR